MRNKVTSLFLKRQREAKSRRNYYFGYYLPMIEGVCLSKERTLKV